MPVARTIWKFALRKGPYEPQTVTMPRGALPISVGMQGKVLMVWVLVDTSQEYAEQEFLVVGTGTPFESGKHLGTVQDNSEVEYGYGPFVWHVFVPIMRSGE